MAIVNMIESLIPRFKTSRFEIDNLLAEATPEFALSIPANSMQLGLRANVIVVLDQVMVFEMSLELLATMKHLGTLLDQTGGAVFMAPPCFNLIVLSVFMPLPIIFATKSFGAGCEGTAIWTGMTFFMFPNPVSAVMGGKKDLLEIAMSDHGFWAVFTSHPLSFWICCLTQRGIFGVAFTAFVGVEKAQNALFEDRLNFFQGSSAHAVHNINRKLLRNFVGVCSHRCRVLFH